MVPHASSTGSDGDVASAREALNEKFVTPCELEQPTLQERAPDHDVACLLHDDVDAGPATLQREYRMDAPSQD